MQETNEQRLHREFHDVVSNMALETISTDVLVGELVNRGFCKIDNCIKGNRFEAYIINADNVPLAFTTAIDKNIHEANIMIVGRA